jgi:hypothetical protein
LRQSPNSAEAESEAADTDLGVVFGAWPALPDATKAGIVSIVKTGLPPQQDLANADELRNAAETLLGLTDADPPLPLPRDVWAALARLRQAVGTMIGDA